MHRRLAPALPLVLLAVCTTAACGPSFDPIELLAGPRLLAVVAEPPETGSGDKTTLSALHYSPGPAVTIDWAYCTQTGNLGSTAPTPTDCVENDTASYIVPIGTGDAVDFTLPTFSDTQFGLPDSTFGIYLPIRVRLITTTKKETGIYRLRFHPAKSPLPKNQNPKLQGMWVVPDDGTAPATGPTSQPLDENMPLAWNGAKPIKLRTALSDGSIEKYQILEGDLTKPTVREVSETISFQWYADAGTWAPATTGPEQPDTAFGFDPKKPERPAAKTKINVYVIARDERGGTAWLHREVVYQP